MIQEKDIDKKEGFLRTNVTEHSLSLLLERLSHAESNTIEHERSLAENVNKNASKESLKELLIAIAEMMAQCYDQLKSKNKRLRSIEIEKIFYEKRTIINCSSVNKAWIEVVNSADTREKNDATNIVLQHILQYFWSTVGSTQTNFASTSLSLPLKNPDEMESFPIRDHAGWAIKRARDIVKSSSIDQLKIKHSPRDDVVLVIDKKQALDLISDLGKDEKQADGHCRFIPNEEFFKFFILLHDVVENLLSKSNIFSQGSKVVPMCLQYLANDKRIRQEWSSLVGKYSFSKQVNVLVLEKICTMFVKSKQQIIREKLALKPQKGSSALRTELKGKVVKSKESAKIKDSEQCSTAVSTSKQKSTSQFILDLREHFESPEKVSHCLHQISQEPNSKELLSQLSGKELTKLLLSLGKSGLGGKKKSRQIDVLLTGDIKVKYPEKVSLYAYIVICLENRNQNNTLVIIICTATISLVCAAQRKPWLFLSVNQQQRLYPQHCTEI